MIDPAQQRTEVIGQLTKAIGALLPSMDIRIVPANGTNVAYAITGARDKNDVVAVPGGIVRSGNGVRACGQPAFGADEAIAKIVLTAMKFDPVMRGAAVIRYSPALIPVLKEMFLDCCSFNKVREPDGISTMDWGVASCCKDGVPDVIFDCDTRGSEGQIRLFGENPVDVANNIIMLSNRIIHVEL